MNIRLRNMTAIYLVRGDKVLLLYRVGSRVGGPSWRGVGGHMEPNEINDPEACVLRELWEETGIERGNISELALRYITLRLKDGEIRQNYYYFAKLAAGKEPEQVSSEGKLKWFLPEELAELEMPVTARHVLEHYTSLGKKDGVLYGGVTREGATEFTPLCEF